MLPAHLGETVDGRVCETLEEIFRRVRFRCIDLEATSLDEEVSCVLDSGFCHFYCCCYYYYYYYFTLSPVVSNAMGDLVYHLGWGKGANVTSAEWQVTLWDPMWHESSRSGEACCKLLNSVYLYLCQGDAELYYLFMILQFLICCY